MQRFSEAEQVFMQDVREKKKAASGVHSRTGKRGYVGKMLFPTDLMTRKEKYNHRKAGKVMTTNMYDEILTVEAFNELETYEQKNRMQHWRLNNTIKEIQDGMGITNAKFYQFIDQLGLPKDRSSKKPRKPRTAKPKPVAVAAIQSALELETIAPAAPIAAPAAPVHEIVVNGLHLGFNGTYSADQIAKQFSKFLALLEDEEDEFYIEMKLFQKAAK